MTLQLDKLREWQREPAQHLFELLSKGKSCVDTSDCGTGKTYVACCVAAALNIPTLVCAPPISKSQWLQASAVFDNSISFVGHEMLRTGRSPYGAWKNPLPLDATDREQFKCTNCQCIVDLQNSFPCHCTAAGIHCVELKRKAHRYGPFTFHSGIKLFVLDEAHRFNALDSLNSDILLAAARQKIPTLCLSATLGNTPANFRALGKLLDLHTLDAESLSGQKPKWSTWAARHKLRRDTATPGKPYRWFAGESEQNEIMRNIRAEIIPARGVRICKDQIPNFPEVEISAELFDLEQADKINDIYQQMWHELAALEERCLLDKSPEAAITIQLRANQAVELLKVPLAVELARSYHLQGLSVGIFVNFSQTIESLADMLGTDCIVDGSSKHRANRGFSISAFQQNTSSLILVNAAAGGLSLNLQDTTGEHPRAGLGFPSFSSTVFKQYVGRFPRDGAKSKSFYKILLAKGTGDEKIYRALRSKLNNLDALNDNDMLPDNLRIS